MRQERQRRAQTAWRLYISEPEVPPFYRVLRGRRPVHVLYSDEVFFHLGGK